MSWNTLVEHHRVLPMTATGVQVRVARGNEGRFPASTLGVGHVHDGLGCAKPSPPWTDVPQGVGGGGDIIYNMSYIT